MFKSILYNIFSKMYYLMILFIIKKKETLTRKSYLRKIKQRFVLQDICITNTKFLNYNKL